MSRYVVHHRKSPYDVYIGRGTLWGNPFSHLPNSRALWTVPTRLDAVREFSLWLPTQPALMGRLHTLRGLVLGCSCAPELCHGDVLAALANDDAELIAELDRLFGNSPDEDT